jgi:hypothetical protein
MKIAILGTRGIPNHHGGFEQFAEYFSVYMANNGHDVYVYNSHNHPFKKKQFKKVNIIHCYDPENLIGTAGQFIYDFKCILNSRNKKFDIILQLGYTSSTIWHKFFPKNTIVVTNMDGLEWKRSKYSPLVKKFLKYAENLGVRHSDFLISDSLGIQKYLKDEYDVASEFIAYGTNVFNSPNNDILKKYNVSNYEYSLVIARLEPENNIETIIRGYIKSNMNNPLIIIGGLNKYGNTLKNKYSSHPNVYFSGANYNIDELNNLRYFSRYYFHGHSVGGTNPSLLEAMGSNALIIAHDNVFNKSILQSNSKYFKKDKDITKILNEDLYFQNKEEFAKRNILKITTNYSWEKINYQYELYLNKVLKEG